MMRKLKKRLLLALLPVVWGASSAGAETGRPAPLPEEEMRVERLAPPDGNRLYVTDFAFTHMVDGRVHVLDGMSGRYLGMISTGYVALATPSPDGRQIHVVTTYYPRLIRGKRADVVEIHDAQTLELKAEIEIPAKRAQALPYRGMLAISADGRFLYVQNATPATSVGVVDLVSGKFMAEIQTPGCWSIHAWREGYRFSTICGDGTLMTVTLDEAGQQQRRERSTPFFDPDKDPIYVHPEMRGDERYFVSYNGNVYSVRLTGDKPEFESAWPLLAQGDKKAHWRPGGLQVSALHRASGTLFVTMHDKGEEGSHKNPAKEIWAFDLASHKRTARIPANAATAIAVSQTDAPMLYALSAATRDITVRAFGKGYPVRRTITAVGDSPVFVEVR
jgi:methylamine dehydrogenase heavy chain